MSSQNLLYAIFIATRSVIAKKWEKTKQNIYPYSGILFDKEKKRSIDRYQLNTTCMNLEKVSLFYMEIKEASY